MEEKFCFVAVEFVDDPNVVGNCYWYLCKFVAVKIGDIVSAPLGRHNRRQDGVVREVRFETAVNAPFPFAYIKQIKKIKKNKNQKNRK